MSRASWRQPSFAASAAVTPSAQIARPMQSSDARLVSSDTLVTHEVPETAVRLLGSVQVAEIASDERARVRSALYPIRLHCHDQRPRVVVDAIARAACGHAVGRVLDDAGIVRHAQKVIETQVGQSAHRYRLRDTARGASMLGRLRGGAEDLEVGIADPRPSHRMGVRRGRGAHPLKLRLARRTA